MKQLNVLILTILVIATFAGCGKQNVTLSNTLKCATSDNSVTLQISTYSDGSVSSQCSYQGIEGFAYYSNSDDASRYSDECSVVIGKDLISSVSVKLSGNTTASAIQYTNNNSSNLSDLSCGKIGTF